MGKRPDFAPSPFISPVLGSQLAREKHRQGLSRSNSAFTGEDRFVDKQQQKSKSTSPLTAVRAIQAASTVDLQSKCSAGLSPWLKIRFEGHLGGPVG